MSKILSDKELIDLCDTGVKHRRMVELAIIHRTIQELSAAGYNLIYSDGEDDYTGQTEQAGVNTLVACDEGRIYAELGGKSKSFVYFVLGNDGTDVICDYGMSLDPIMQKIQDWTDAQEAAGTF